MKFLPPNSYRWLGVLHCLLLLSLASTAATATEGRLVFLHLNDIHAHLLPHQDMVRNVSSDGSATAFVEERGGLARTATLINQIRAQEHNTVLMNIGDTYHGGVEALYSRGNAIVAPVNALGIDIGVPGNWDFAYGPLVTRLRYSKGSAPLSGFVNKLVSGEPVATPNYPVIAGNVRKTFALLLENKPLLPATHLQSFGGISVGFIGITSDIVPRMSPMLAWGFTFLSGEDAYVELINRHARKLRGEGADLVIVMSELGIHRDHQLANAVDPGVDVFFSAHTHETTLAPLSSKSGAIVVESGDDGYLGKMTVTINESTGPVFEWQLLDIDERIAQDPEMVKLVAAARAPFLDATVNFKHPMPFVDQPLTEPINTVVGAAPKALHRRDILDSPFNHFLADQMRQHYKTDLALTPGFRFDAVLAKGATITLEDLYRYLPVPPQIARGQIAARDLKEVLETELTRVFSKDAFNHSGGWMMGTSGLDIAVDTNRADGNRVISISLAGSRTEVDPDELLSVVSCVRPYDDDGVLCSNSGFQNIEELPNPDGNSWTPLEFLRYRLESGQATGNQSGLIQDSSNPATWPVSEFMQPLHTDNGIR